MSEKTPARREPSQRTLASRTRRIVRILEEAYGVPRGRKKREPLETLIHGVLSQNTTDVNSWRAYERLMGAFGSWDAVKRARVCSIERAIRCGGLSKVKAGRIKEILRRVEADFGALSLAALHKMDLDEALDRLRPLPGVGVKTVTVTLLFACGRDICPVDTHVHRLARRIGLVPGKSSRDRTFFALRPLIGRGKGYSLHCNLIRHGRSVCKAQRPRCGECTLRRQCDWAKAHSADSAC